MKKFLFAFISCLVLAYVPITSFAGKKIYIGNQTSSEPSGPRRSATWDFFTIEVDQDSCNLCITFLDDVTDVGLYMTKNRVTYEEDELDVVTGQTVVYELENYSVGEYDFTIEVDGNVIEIITVIIEE